MILFPNMSSYFVEEVVSQAEKVITKYEQHTASILDLQILIQEISNRVNSFGEMFSLIDEKVENHARYEELYRGLIKNATHVVGDTLTLLFTTFGIACNKLRIQQKPSRLIKLFPFLAKPLTESQRSILNEFIKELRDLTSYMDSRFKEVEVCLNEIIEKSNLKESDINKYFETAKKI